MSAADAAATLAQKAGDLAVRARVAAGELRAAEVLATQAAENLRQASAAAGATANDLLEFADEAAAFRRQFAEPGGFPPPAPLPPAAKAAPLPPAAAAPLPAKAPPPAAPGPGFLLTPGGRPFKAPPPVRGPPSAAAAGGAVAAVRYGSSSRSRNKQDRRTAEWLGGAGSAEAPPPPPPPASAADFPGAAAPPPPPPSPAEVAAEYWRQEALRRAALPKNWSGGYAPRSRGARGSAYFRRTSAERFAKEEWADTGIEPPYRVRTGRVPGFKVHVGNLDAEWGSEGAEQAVEQVLDLAGYPAADYAKFAKLSPNGGLQLVCTWRTSAEAVRGKTVLHDYTWADGTRANAKYWTPEGYSPWQSDERFAPPAPSPDA